MIRPTRWLLGFLTVAAGTFVSCTLGSAVLTAQVVTHPYSALVHEERRLDALVREGLVRRAIDAMNHLQRPVPSSSAREPLELLRSRATDASGLPTIADAQRRSFAERRPQSPFVAQAWVDRGLSSLSRNDDAAADLYLGQGADHAYRDVEVRHDSVYIELEHMARYWQGVTRARRGMYLEAVTSFEQSVAADSAGRYADQSIYEIGLIHERNGAFDLAQRAYRTLRGQYPTSIWSLAARIREAENALRDAQPERCLDVLTGCDEEVLRLDSSVRRTLVDIDLHPDKRRDREEMLSLVQRFPEQLSVIRSTALLMRENYARASDSCSAAIARYPGSPYLMLIHLQRAFAGIHQGRYDQVLADCAIVLDSVADESSVVRQQALLYRALALQRLEQHKEALRILLELGSRSDYLYRAQAMLEVGQAAYQDGRFVDAAQALERSARTSEDASTTIRAELLLGATRIEQQRWRDAAQSYSRAEALAEQASPSFVVHRERFLAEARLKKGICLVQAGDERQAIAGLTDFLANHPKDRQRDEATFWLAEAMYRENLLSNAEELYTELVMDETASIRREEAMYGLAWTQFRRKRLREAATSFQRLVNTYPTSKYALDALARQGDALYILRDYTSASARYADAARKSPRSEAGQYAGYQAGKSLYLQGAFDKATSALRLFVSSSSSSRLADDALFLIGWIAFQQRRDEEAITEFRRLLDAYPDGDHAERALYTTADAQYNLGRTEEAIATYRQVISRFPTHPLATEAAKSMQMVLVGEGRTDEALAIADNLIQSNPQSAVAEEFTFKKAEIFYSGAQYANAAAELRAYVNAFPGSQRGDEALYLLARTYLSMSEESPALASIRDLERKYASSPFLAKALMDLASYRDQHAQAESADSLYAIVMNRFAADSAEASRAGFDRATLARMRGDSVASLQHFTWTADRYAGYEYGDQARYQIALWYRQAGSLEKAQVELATLVRTTPNKLIAANALYDMGDMYARQRMWKEAASIFERVRQEYAGYEDWYTLSLIGLGACYEQLQELSEARIVYRIIVDMHPDDDYGRTAKARLERMEKRR